MNPTPNGDNNDWQRWRGTVDQKLDQLHSDVTRFSSTCFGCQRGVESKFELLHSRITELHEQLVNVRVRQAMMIGGAGALGGAVSEVIRFFTGG